MFDFNNTATADDIRLVELIAQTHIGTVDSPPINIPVGSVNKVFHVNIQNQAYIFRISQNSNKNTVQEYEKEQWSIEQASRAGVRTADVLQIGTAENAAFMIQTFVEGKPCTDETLNKGLIWEAFGANLAKTHSVLTQGYGLDTIDKNDNRFSESWQQSIEYNINSIHPQDLLLTLGYVSLDEHAAIKACFETMRTTDWRFGLSHGDISLRNGILNDDGQVTLIDWGCAGSRIVPFRDFAQIIKSEPLTQEEFEAFLHGYGIDSKSYSQIMYQTKQVALYAAVDTLRWAIAHAVVARNRYIAALRWALDLYFGKIAWFSEPYHEKYGLQKLNIDQ